LPRCLLSPCHAHPHTSLWSSNRRL
jgi:hypothetical protein